MTVRPDLKPLIDHLCNANGLTSAQARHIVDDVIAYLRESPEAFVRRRHGEIKQETGLSNEPVFRRIEAELDQLVFAAPKLTPRQIRRIIYG